LVIQLLLDMLLFEHMAFLLHLLERLPFNLVTGLLLLKGLGHGL